MVKKVCFAFLFLLPTAIFNAQVGIDIYEFDYYETGELTDLLNEQLGDFQTNFQDLMITRGISEYKSSKFGVKAIEDLLSNYTQTPFNRNTSENHKTALVFYHHQNDTLFTWVMGNTIYLMIHDVKAEKLAELEFSLKSALSTDVERGGDSENLNPIAPINFDSISHELGQLLMPSQLLRCLKNYEHLLIVPCLNIGSIPLYALKPNPSNEEYLVDLKLITIAHSFDEINKKIIYQQNDLNISASEIRQNAGDKLYGENDVYPIKPRNPLIIGNPSFKGCSDQFDQLDGAEMEAKYAAQKFNSPALIGEVPTKSLVRSELKKSEFLYFATHGFADSKDPINKSYLVFSSEKKGDCSYLSPKEIQEDSISQSALVILSACQTGLGRVLDAGIIGLGRSFLKAGAANVVMSLWNVGDKATQEMMQLYVDELFIQKEYLTSSSLRNAILAYKKINPNPKAWAAFISMGLPIGIKSVYVVE
jgi:CHAT domain-containing protein